MLANYKVGLWNNAPSTKVNGITIPGVLTYVKDMMVDLQPYSTALLIKDYGYDIEVNKRIFCDYDSAIKIGTVFFYTNKESVIEKYEVKNIVEWDFLDLALLGVS